MSFFEIALAFLCLSAQSEEPSAKVTLEEAKNYAIQHNSEVIALRREVDEKSAESGRAKSFFYPTLGVSAGAESTQGGKTGALGYAYANYNVFRGFGDIYRSQISDINEEMAQVRLKQAEFKVGLAVEEQFHLYLFKKMMVGLKSDALKLNEAHKEMAAKRQRAGMGSVSDIIEFDLRESLLQSDIMLVKEEQEEVRIRLRKLLGEQIGSQIEPVGGLQHRHLKGNLMGYLTKLKDSSETVKLANRELARSQIESRQWRANWLPQFDVEAQVGYLKIGDRPDNGGLGVRGSALAKFDVFSGFSTSWERRAGKAKLLKAEAQLKQTIQNALIDTETAYRRLKTVQERVDIEEKNETRSQRYYEAVVGEYRRGVKNSADVKVAAEVLFSARARNEEFKYEFLKGKVVLEGAIGRLIETEVLPD